MSMSRDRVRFTLNTFGITQATQDAFLKAFGQPIGTCIGDVTIICRPSQFARFLIFRNELGGRNSFKELNPVLFTPEVNPSTFDVSRNPAR
jgi:hypothetical protein